MKATNDRRNLVILAAITLLAGASNAQVRDWGFDLDSVYEQTPGKDSVLLTNSGADSLKFDSAWLELLTPATDGLLIHFRVGKHISAPIYHLNTPATSPRGVNPRHLVVAPFQSVELREFYIDADAPPLARRAAFGDTLRARMIFRTASRGSDTLILIGVQHTTSIRSSLLPARQRSLDARFFDPLGRRMEPTVRGSKVTMPLLSPEE